MKKIARLYIPKAMASFLQCGNALPPPSDPLALNEALNQKSINSKICTVTGEKSVKPTLEFTDKLEIMLQLNQQTITIPPVPKVLYIYHEMYLQVFHS